MNVTGIASAAKSVSFDQLAQTYESHSISTLKKAIDSQASIQSQIVQMMNEASPHLGSNINMLA